MTRNEIVTYGRLFGRVTTLGVTDAEAYDLVNQCIKDFSEDVRGIVKEEGLQIEALFWPETAMAINIAIVGGTNVQAAADVAITAADADAQTGTEMAALLQTAIRTLGGISTATVAWANFAFTVDSQDGTDITIAAPSATTTYEDATKMLFGGTGSSGAQTYVGAFPEECTKRIALPANFRDLRSIEWDKDPLEERPLRYVQAQESSGTPYYYALGGDDDYLWLDRSPTTRKTLWLEYKATPADLSTDAAPDFEVDYHWALVWRLAELFALTQFADEVAAKRHEQYQEVVNSYNARYGNRRTQMKTDRDDRQGRLWRRRRRTILYSVD